MSGKTTKKTAGKLGKKGKKSKNGLAIVFVLALWLVAILVVVVWPSEVGALVGWRKDNTPQINNDLAQKNKMESKFYKEKDVQYLNVLLDQVRH